MAKKVLTNPNWPTIEFKSLEELYFSYYCDELIESGFAEKAVYEEVTFNLSGPVKFESIKQLKTKAKTVVNHLLHGSSCTADFSILWTPKALGIFAHDISKSTAADIPKIPFMFVGNSSHLISHVEIKAENESSTSSSVSFPYKQKWVFQRYSVLVQKIQPFGKKKTDTLFRKTFYPKAVLANEVYKVNCAGGRVGESKIKHKTKTIEEFLDGR